MKDTRREAMVRQTTTDGTIDTRKLRTGPHALRRKKAYSGGPRYMVAGLHANGWGAVPTLP